MTTRIKIKGGAVAYDYTIAQINEDGSETELTGVTKIEISPIIVGGLVTVKLTIIDVNLDINVVAELVK